jgi:hypothetical protein
MKSSEIMRLITNKNIVIITILALALLVPLIYYVAAAAFTHVPEPFLEKPANAAKCIRETGYMRDNHMILLKEIRDQALREGKSVETGFGNCRECHPNRETFCDRCHDAASLNPDCFHCHYYPPR